VPTAPDASGLEQAASSAVLGATALANTLLNRALTCLAASGTACLAKLTIMVILRAPRNTTRLAARTLLAAIGQAVTAKLAVLATQLVAAHNNTTLNLAPT